jgi:hypothetical protein
MIALAEWAWLIAMIGLVVTLAVIVWVEMDPDKESDE